MKFHFLILTSLMLIVIGCKDDCEGNECCNPNTSEVIISDYSKSWTPFQDGEQTELISGDLSISFSESIQIIDSTYWQGDECPLRPGQYIFGDLSNENDTITFETARYTTSVEVDGIYFYICGGECLNTGPLNQLTTVELMKDIELFGSLYDEAIHAKSTQGGITALYLAKDVGVIAIEKEQVLYQLK